MTEEHHLTRQDEDMSAAEFIAEETEDHFDFGNWPELFGLCLMGFLIWLTFAFTG